MTPESSVPTVPPGFRPHISSFSFAMSKANAANPELQEPLLLPDARDTTTSEHNPLGDISQETLFADVERFAQVNGLMRKLELLQRAALLIQAQMPMHEIPGITAREKEALRDETERKWRQPKTLYFTILVCSVGAVVQGWAQTGSNGANLSFPQAFGLGTNSGRDNFLVGLINAGPFISVGVCGAWTSEPVNNMLGRRGAVFFGGSFSLISHIGSSLSRNWPQLLAFRLLLGVGLGVSASTVSVYAAECAPASIRGGLAVSWQMWTAFGIFLGFLANVILYNYGAIAWRLQLASAFIPTVPLLVLVYFCPESPSWFIKSGGRYNVAFRSLSRLRNTELQAAKELYSTYIQHRMKSMGSRDRPSFTTKILQLFTVPRNRRATTASYIVMLSQQLCGINIIAFYSSTIFLDAGFSKFSALLASCGFGFVNFAFAFPAVWTIDTLGRRLLLLLTLPPMALTMLAAGLCFNIPSDNPVRFRLLITMIYLFCAEYSPGMGPVPFTYSAEVFPLSHREVGMSFATATASCWAAVLSLTFPRILAALKPQGAFCLYAGLNLLAFVLLFLFLPETKQRTLDELDDIFAIPTKVFIKHQTTEVLRRTSRRRFLLQRNHELSR